MGIQTQLLKFDSEGKTSVVLLGELRLVQRHESALIFVCLRSMRSNHGRQEADTPLITTTVTVVLFTRCSNSPSRTQVLVSMFREALRAFPTGRNCIIESCQSTSIALTHDSNARYGRLRKEVAKCQRCRIFITMEKPSPSPQIGSATVPVTLNGSYYELLQKQTGRLITSFALYEYCTSFFKLRKFTRRIIIGNIHNCGTSSDVRSAL